MQKPTKMIIKEDPSTKWSYVFEGGKHAIFKYTNGERQGKLLRIRREDLVSNQPSSSNSDYILDFILYLREVVVPRLVPYTEVPDTIELQPPQVKELYQEAISSGKIPLLRRKTWEEEEDGKGVNHRVLASASLDYRQIPGCHTTQSKQCWSIEIKPKAGYMTFSPCVDPKHRIKYKKTKFAIQQALISKSIIQKGWMRAGVKVETCPYNPLQFFSGDQSQIAAALTSLFAVPQNYIKVWNHEGTIVHSNKVLDQVSLLDQKILQQSLAFILQSENVCSKLLQMQLLDVIDADGAVLVYNRLVELCNGDHEHAEHLVDHVEGDLANDTNSTTDEGPKACDSPLSSSPFRKPTDSPALDRLLEQVRTFSNPTSLTDDELDQSYNDSVAIIRTLSKSACVFLLQNWLLSLAMCDVGILIVLAPTVDDKNEEATINADDFKIELKNLQLQGESAPGMIEVNGHPWVYSVKVVDCGNKSAISLRKLEMKEKDIAKL